MEDLLTSAALCTLAIMAALIVVAGAGRGSGIRGPRAIPKPGPTGRIRGQSSNHPPVKWDEEQS